MYESITVSLLLPKILLRMYVHTYVHMTKTSHSEGILQKFIISYTAICAGADLEILEGGFHW